MFAEERQGKIEEILTNKESIKVSEIAEIFNVSESTIRRDLQEMEEKKLLTRTHGGAVGINRRNFEPSFSEKSVEHSDEKRIIGELAADLIEDGDTLILDSGTTTLEIAKCIRAKNLTVITNSIDIAAELSSRESVEIIVTGGTLRLNTRAMVGSIADGVLSNFKADKAFIGANGISVEDGVTTPNFMEAQTKRAMFNSANKVYVVCDRSKFNEVSFSLISPIRGVTSVITAGEVDRAVVDAFSDVGVEILTR
jgi:DeoR family fructose operon transcriptional repressor